MSEDPTQPPQNGDYQQSVQPPLTGAGLPPTVPASPSSKKKLVIIVLAVVILLGGIAAYYVLAIGSNDSAANSELSDDQTIQQTQAIEKKVLNIQDGNTKLQLDSAGSLAELEQVAPTVPGGHFFSVLSNDKSKFVYFEQGDDYPIESYITVQSLSDPEDEQRLAEAWTDDHGPLGPVAWSTDDDQTIALQEYSCFECDGPALPIIWKISTAMDEINKEVLVDLTDKSTWGSAISSISRGGAYVAIANVPSALGGTVKDYQNAKRELHIYDVLDDSSKIVYEIADKDQYISNVVGWTEDASEVLLVISDFSEDQQDGLMTSFSHIARVNISTGAVSEIPLVLSELAADQTASFGSAAIFEGSLIFTTFDFDPDEEATLTRLYSLPLDGGENPVTMLRMSSGDISIGTSETIIVEQ